MKAHPAPCTPVLASITCLVLLALLPLPTVAAAPRAHMHMHLHNAATITRHSARPAARTAPAAPTMPAAPVELSKVILPETSPTGPALWTNTGATSSTTYNAVLAWTGTDPAHHVNVRTSTNGQDFGPTVTLGETAISRPAVTAILESVSFPRILVLAWTGTDARHSLNVLFDVFNVTGHRSKTTLVDTSIAGPALTRDQFLVGERVQLAWTGTNPNHSLNVLQLNEVCTRPSPPPCRDVIGLSLGPRVTLPGQLHSLSGPELTSDIFLDQSKVLLTWAQTENAQLGLALVSPVGTPPSFVFFSPQTSAARPDVLALARTTEHFWWTWAGTDPAHSLNLMDTADFHTWSGPVTTFVETATGGPVLGSVGAAHRLLLAWTGTDPAHHLNVAVIGV